MKEKLYVTRATSTGGREGMASLNDNSTTFKLGLPLELGGAGADKALNPEQLFASGYSACFEGAVAFVSKRDNLSYKANGVEAEAILSKRDGGFTIDVNLTANFSNITQEQADSLMKEADKVCPYSYILKGGNSTVTLTAKVI